MTATTWRDAVGGANETTNNARDAGHDGNYAGAPPRLTAKATLSTDEAFPEDVEALATHSYPH